MKPQALQSQLVALVHMTQYPNNLVFIMPCCTSAYESISRTSMSVPLRCTDAYELISDANPNTYSYTPMQPYAPMSGWTCHMVMLIKLLWHANINPRSCHIRHIPKVTPPCPPFVVPHLSTFISSFFCHMFELGRNLRHMVYSLWIWEVIIARNQSGSSFMNTSSWSGSCYHPYKVIRRER